MIGMRVLKKEQKPKPKSAKVINAYVSKEPLYFKGLLNMIPVIIFETDYISTKKTLDKILIDIE